MESLTLPIYSTNVLVLVSLAKSIHITEANILLGKRFRKYLVISWPVCFTYFTFIFCPFPVSITRSVSLIGLPDRFESEKDRPKKSDWVKGLQNIILRFFFYSVKIPFEQAWGHSFTLDWILCVVRFLFQTVAKICNCCKVGNFCDRVNPPLVARETRYG